MSLLLQALAVLALNLAIVNYGSAESFEDMKAPAPKADGGPGFDEKVGAEPVPSDDTFHKSVKDCFRDKSKVSLNRNSAYCKWWVRSLARDTTDSAIKLPPNVDTFVIIACLDRAMKAKAASETSSPADKNKVQAAGSPRWKMITWAFASRCGVSKDDYPRLLTHAFQNIMIFFNNFVHVSHAEKGDELIRALTSSTVKALVEDGSDIACHVLYKIPGFESYTWWTMKLVQMAIGESLARKAVNKPKQPWYILAETYEAPPPPPSKVDKKM